MCDNIDNMVNKPLAIAMYLQGFSLGNIGKEFGVSRQRIWQIVKKHYSSISNDLKERNKPKPGMGWCIPNPSEKYVYSKLRRRGYNPKYLDYCNTADLMVGNKRVQIKYRSLPTYKGNNAYYHFNYLTEKIKPDVYVFVCGNLVKPLCYVVSGEKIDKDSMSISVEPKSRKTKRFRRNHLEKWSIIKTIKDPLDIPCML